MIFSAEGSLPLYLNGTRNCSVPQLDPESGVAMPMCCDGIKTTSDFDVSSDNRTWTTGFDVQVQPDGSAVKFLVHTPVKPLWVRYTANKQFPQCAVFNQEGLPALPFQLAIQSETTATIKTDDLEG